MSERLSLDSTTGASDLDQLLQQVDREYARPTTAAQYGLNARWRLYNYAEEPVDFYHNAFEAVRSSQHDTILDVGCSDGTNLLTNRLTTAHKGRLLGIDIHPAIFTFGREVNRRIPVQVDFVAARGEALPLRDQSIDGAMAMFMLYHVPNPEHALQELVRVVKPLGRIAVATSGPNNKREQRTMERKIGEYLSIEPPGLFNRRFDTRIAEIVLPKFFTVEETIHQESTVPVRPWQGQPKAFTLSDFLGSLDSMRIHFNPVPSRTLWLKARRVIVLPQLREIFKQHGQLDEQISRKLYVCRNDFAQE